MMARMTLLIWLVFGMVAFGGDDGSAETESTPATTVSFDYAAVVSDTIRYWVPSDELMASAAESVTRYLESAAPELYAKLDRYCCQFWGVTSDSGRRLYCNFLECYEVEGDYWKTHPMIFDDGGDSYFQLEYDIESRKCMNLTINGVA